MILLNRGLDQTGAQGGCLVNVHAQRLTDIGPVGQFGDTGQADMVDPFGKGKTPRDG